MKENSLIETFGTITKKETLASLEEDFSNGILILENKFPFPGYHGSTIPDAEVLYPDSVFLITKQAYDTETILRASQNIKAKFQEKFDPAMGIISLQNEMTPCIRIKQLTGFSILPELVDLYKQEGIQFSKYKDVSKYEAIIEIKKFFVLTMPEPGLFMDEEEQYFCYVQIPKQLLWDDFEKTTLDIKRNMENNKFDAALGTIYRRNKVLDVVRLYGKQVDRKNLDNIKERYLKEIKN